jgi:hypothetical protein
MAAIAPQLSFCVGTNCTKLTITDVTGLYNNTTNIKGWGNSLVATGIETSEILTSVVTLTNIDTDEVFTFTLKGNNVNLYPAEATPEFSFADFNWTAGDGIYSVSHIVTVDSPNTAVEFTDKILVDCAAKACITEQWKKYFTECNCSGAKDLLMSTLELEGMLKGLQAEFLCNQDQKAIKILSTLDKICSSVDGDCGCH